MHSQQVQQHGRHQWVGPQDEGEVKDGGQRRGGQHRQAGQVVGGVLREDGQRQVVPVVRLVEGVVQREAGGARQQVGVEEQARQCHQTPPRSADVGSVRAGHRRRGGIGEVPVQHLL